MSMICEWKRSRLENISLFLAIGFWSGAGVMVGIDSGVDGGWSTFLAGGGESLVYGEGVGWCFEGGCGG